jgi:hypothetical protein
MLACCVLSRVGWRRLAGVWLVFGWCLAVVAGGWAREPDPQLQGPGPSRTAAGWLVPVVHVAVCVRAPQARWQKATMPLGIGCCIAGYASYGRAAHGLSRERCGCYPPLRFRSLTFIAPRPSHVRGES